MGWVENRLAYNAKYAKEKLRRYVLNFNRSTDADILEYLESVDNFTSYIKALIRKDMEDKA